MAIDLDERILLARERTELANERNRLANERTYLAWTRTGLASVAGGLAMIRFLTFQNLSHEITSQILGCVLVLLGIVIFSLSIYDYQSTYKKLRIHQGYAGSLWMISAISLLLIVISIVLLFIVFKSPEIH